MHILSLLSATISSCQFIYNVLTGVNGLSKKFIVLSSSNGMNRMRNDFIFYKRAYEDNSQNPLWQYMLEYFADRYSGEAKRILNAETLDTQTTYSIRLYCYGAVGMTREWLLTDNITPAEIVVEMMFNSMPESLRTIFFH